MAHEYISELDHPLGNGMSPDWQHDIPKPILIYCPLVH